MGLIETADHPVHVRQIGPYLSPLAMHPDGVSMTLELTVTAKGQVTLRRAALDHLGVVPGAKSASRCWRTDGSSWSLPRPATT